MKGHAPILRMRLAGKRPAIVFINDFPDKSADTWHNPGEKYNETWPSDHATVCTHGSTLSSLDLRFLIGSKVSISSDCENRAMALFEKAKNAGASVVAATHSIAGQYGRFSAGWTQIYYSKEVDNG